MARKSRKVGRDPKATIRPEVRAIKSSLNKVLLPQYRTPFIQLMESYCLAATEISFLGSMLFLHKVNDAFDNKNEDFFNQNGTAVIRECFLGVVDDGNHANLPAAFRINVQQHRPNIPWPNRVGMGNTFNYLYQQFEDNTKTNLKTWYVTRIKAFLRMRCYEFNHGKLVHRKPANIGVFNETDVKNTAKYLVNQRDWTGRSPERQRKMQFLLNEVERIGGPPDNNLKQFVTRDWFKAIKMFVNISRQIDHFHKTYAFLNTAWARYMKDRRTNQQPRVPRPPKVNNFKAIPVHDYHLKHIRIDTKQFYEIASKFMVLKEAKGKRGKPVNISREVYNSYPAYFWGKLFDMDKINQIGGNNMQFDFSIVTNSVSVSLNYIKLNCESNEIGLEQIKEMYDKCEFVFELGIDPGIKTFNATVRRRIANQTEVNEHLVKFMYKLLIDYFVCIFFSL